MAIQMRRGSDSDFQSNKYLMLPGEIAVAMDTNKVYVCTSAGIIKELSNNEDVTDQVLNRIATAGSSTFSEIQAKVNAMDSVFSSLTPEEISALNNTAMTNANTLQKLVNQITLLHTAVGSMFTTQAEYTAEDLQTAFGGTWEDVTADYGIPATKTEVIDARVGGYISTSTSATEPNVCCIIPVKNANKYNLSTFQFSTANFRVYYNGYRYYAGSTDTVAPTTITAQTAGADYISLDITTNLLRESSSTKYSGGRQSVAIYLRGTVTMSGATPTYVWKRVA